MILPVFTALTVIILIYLCAIPKQLRISEMLFIWMVATFLNINFTTIVTLNQKWIRLSDSAVAFLGGYFMNRNVITPALLVWLMHRYSSPSATVTKTAATVWVIVLLAGLECISGRLGVTKYVQWKIVYSIPVWFLMIFVTYIALRGFRRLLRKEAIAE